MTCGRRLKPLDSRWGALAAAVIYIVLASGVTSTSSMFVVYRRERGFTPADIALVFAAYVGTLLPMLLLMSGVVHRFRRRPVVAAGVAFAAASMVCLSLAQGVPLLVAGRFAQGIAVGLSIGALTAAFSESYGGKLPTGTAIQVMATIGLATGPLITAIAYNLGGGLNWSYVPTLVLTVAALAMVSLLPETARAAHSNAMFADATSADAMSSSAAPVSDVLPKAEVWRGLGYAMPVIFTSWASLSIFLSLMPSYINTTLRADNPLVGAAAIIAAQASSLTATLLFKRFAPEKSGGLALVVMIVGLTLLVIGTRYTLWPLIGVSTVLVGGGAGVAAAAAFGVAERVSAGQRDKVFARMYVAGYLGYSVPAVAIGLIAARWSLTAGIASVIVVLAGITGVVMVRSRRSV